MSMGAPALKIEEPQLPARITATEYLRTELEREIRHEFAGGYLHPVEDPHDQHELVSVNVLSAIYLHLKGKAFRVYKSQMKLHVHMLGNDLFYYPDVMVCCDPTDNHPYFKEHPKLIVEVLTEWKRDLVEKNFTYRHIPALEEYIVIGQDPANQRAWIFRRADNWQPREVTSGTLTFASIDLSLELSSLYQF